MKRFFSTLCLVLMVSFGMLSASAPAFAQQHTLLFRSHHVCGAAAINTARCSAIRLDGTTSSAGLTVTPNASAPSGYNPSDLQSAYKLSASGGNGQTVAIVDAYDDPNAESDLAVYRSRFNLPACTTAIRLLLQSLRRCDHGQQWRQWLWSESASSL